MQRLLVAAFLLAAIVAGCSSSQGPWMPAFVDPAYHEAAFHSVAVFADTGDFAWRKNFESRVSAELIDAEVASAQASWFITPTRVWTTTQRNETLLAKGFDACLQTHLIASTFTSRFIPEERVTTSEKVPIVERVRVKVNGKWVEKDSVMSYRDVRKSTTSGGYSETREYRTFRLTLTDLRADCVAWTGEYSAWADQFSFDAFARAAARQLVWDRIVAPKQVKR
jgi:hypothetical protein